jgi:hypothetical protein
MSQPQFLADHDLNEHIVEGLLRREPALRIVRAREVGMAQRPDAEVLEYAAAHGLILVSHDVNTMTAAAYERIAAGLPVAGLVMARQSDPVGAVIDDLVLIWSSSESDEWKDVVIFLPL